MGKIIRPTYPAEFSVGLLLLIFVLSFFLSHQIFEVPLNDLGADVYLGMFLVSTALIIVLLILWEEFLFPIKVKPTEQGGVIFRNHRTKLIKQLLIYCIIPIIFSFIYVMYEVNHVRFIIWAAVCIITPVAGKLISGIKNYNDFLTLNDGSIEYKNNKKTGVFQMKEIQRITLVKDERNVLHKVQLIVTDNSQVTIDLDEMELEEFYVAIDKYITTHYKNLLN